jgi:hypothetical protein
MKTDNVEWYFMPYFIIECPCINLIKYHTTFDINDFKLGHIDFSGALAKHLCD